MLANVLFYDVPSVYRDEVHGPKRTGVTYLRENRASVRGSTSAVLA